MTQDAQDIAFGRAYRRLTQAQAREKESGNQLTGLGRQLTHIASMLASDPAQVLRELHRVPDPSNVAERVQEHAEAQRELAAAEAAWKELSEA